MSSIESRLSKLEEAAGITDWAALCPADCPIERWERIGMILRELPPELFHPWRDLAHVIADLTPGRREKLLNCSDPVIKASMQIRFEELGEVCPPWVWRMGDLSTETLERMPILQCDGVLSDTEAQELATEWEAAAESELAAIDAAADDPI